jgi:hypothetical protein
LSQRQCVFQHTPGIADPKVDDRDARHQNFAGEQARGFGPALLFDQTVCLGRSVNSDVRSITDVRRRISSEGLGGLIMSKKTIEEPKS